MSRIACWAWVEMDGCDDIANMVQSAASLHQGENEVPYPNWKDRILLRKTVEAGATEAVEVQPSTNPQRQFWQLPRTLEGLGGFGMLMGSKDLR